MGRPINHKKIGGNATGKIVFSGVVDAGNGLEDCYLVEQVSATRYKLKNADEDVAICKLTTSTPDEIGECRLLARKSGGTTATARVIMSLDSVTIDAPGTGMTDDQYILTLVGGDPVSAAPSIVVTVTGGEAVSAAVEEQEDGYYELPEDIDPITITETFGGGTPPTISITFKVDSIEIIDGGSGYSEESEPEYDIEASVAPGTAVDVDQVIVTDGVITSVTLNSGGEDYTVIPTIEFGPPPEDVYFVTKLEKNVVTLSGLGKTRYDLGKQNNVDYDTAGSRCYLPVKA